jgi:hypothetical protein
MKTTFFQIELLRLKTIYIIDLIIDELLLLPVLWFCFTVLYIYNLES